jgi:hypothetical protein
LKLSEIYINRRGVRRLVAATVRYGVYIPAGVAHGDWWAVREPPRRFDLTVVGHDGWD